MYQACCLSGDDSYVVVNAFNEWGEGMALEPSNIFGDRLLQALRTAKAWAGKCRKDAFLLCEEAGEIYRARASLGKEEKAWLHYLRVGRATSNVTWFGEICKTALSCEEARKVYLEDNPDVFNAKADPWDHYRLHGKNEGRLWPGKHCHITCEKARELYLIDYPDIAEAHADPWLHYSTVGKGEFRKWRGDLCFIQNHARPSRL